MKINKKVIFGIALTVIVGLLVLNKVRGAEVGEISVSYISDHTIRGATVVERAVQTNLAVDVGIDLPIVDLDLYNTSSLTSPTDSNIGSNIVNDIRLGGTAEFGDTLTFDVGVRYLDIDTVSKEVYVGVKLDSVLDPSVYVFRSLNQDFTAVEGAVEYNHVVKLWLTEIDLDTAVKLTGGYVDGPIENGYVTGRCVVDLGLTEEGSVFAGVEATASTAEEYEDKVAFVAGYTRKF
jgi:hypothetical protein